MLAQQSSLDGQDNSALSAAINTPLMIVTAGGEWLERRKEGWG